jgi:inward rectifier potassium channel
MANPKGNGRVRPMRVRKSAFALHKSGVAPFDLRDPYHLAVSLSWPAFIGAAFAGLFAINLGFAILYAIRPGAIDNLPPGDLPRAFFFSLETLATVGYGEMAPQSLYGHAVAGVEIVLGMASTAIFTGLLFVRFSRPQSKILFADKAVVCRHNGALTLMVRIANGRLTMLTHAAARLAILVGEISAEGHTFRRVLELTLVRDKLPIFPLTWTLMHVIDEASPLFGLGPEALATGDIRLYLAVEARDVALGAMVQDIGDYPADRVLFGRRYADAVSIDEQGRTVADIARLSLIEPAD